MIPFARTVCSCAKCQACCRVQPGHLIPGQLEAIAAHLGVTVAEASASFWASGGAVALCADGVQRRVGTITPRFDIRAGRCVFLTDTGACRIHAVAPFGCAYFDTHMSAAEGNRRSVWGLAVIDGDAGYAAERGRLPFATHYKPRRY
jgi:Fe-S-cluster containining protein